MGAKTMRTDEYGYREVAEVQFRNLSAQITELKDRVQRLETTVARGVLLLVANLFGIAASLASQLLHG